MWPSLKLALPGTADVHNLSSKFERCVVFRFRLKEWHGTDGRTDRRVCNA